MSDKAPRKCKDCGIDIPHYEKVCKRCRYISIGLNPDIISILVCYSSRMDDAISMLIVRKLWSYYGQPKGERQIACKDMGSEEFHKWIGDVFESFLNLSKPEMVKHLMLETGRDWMTGMWVSDNRTKEQVAGSYIAHGRKALKIWRSFSGDAIARESTSYRIDAVMEDIISHLRNFNNPEDKSYREDAMRILFEHLVPFATSQTTGVDEAFGRMASETPERIARIIGYSNNSWFYCGSTKADKLRVAALIIEEARKFLKHRERERHIMKWGHVYHVRERLADCVEMLLKNGVISSKTASNAERGIVQWCFDNGIPRTGEEYPPKPLV
jgi:hypothetical protein